ncbi:DUF2218 domain-containing protein [Mangrovicella endophytica]|uniref:DUF2218 domain-containing protein n=1 Tax=Mangrovicella endophytica TaxID=2066697 RepID=UPI000C9E1D6A|nr:DUF2218 domain-containing protein [Mangrovicella endophytica]
MTETTAVPLRSTAVVETAQASRYLQQLCKHFAHKLPVSFDPAAGSIDFPFGSCRLAADDARLTLTLDAPGSEEMDRLQEVVVRHLERFAFREELAVAWQPA